VLKLFTNDSISENTPFHQVQAQAFGILNRQKLDFIADHIAKNVKFDETAFQWEHVDKLSHQFKLNLRPILSAVDFDASSAQDALIEAVHFLKNMFRKGKSLSQYPPNTFPTRFIQENTKRYLYKQDSQGLPSNEVKGRKYLLVDRYEFLVYRLLHNGLLAGDIFCRDSVRFRSFEDDLIDDQKWQEKEKLIDLTGLTILKQPIAEHLQSLEQLLEERIAVVNGRISSGENKHLKIKRRGQHVHWTLQYPRSSESVNHPLFDALKQVDISDVMHFVNQHCQFMEAFSHILGRYTKQEADDRAITACLVAWGTNTGLSKMGDISDFRYHTLAAVSDNFIRLETLSEVNDCVCNAIAVSRRRPLLFA